MVSQGVLLSGRYRLDERIGAGGMGDVWRGHDEVLGRTVAVKIMLPALVQDQGFTARFRAEARTMATIDHSGVVRIYDFGQDDQTAYLVMEFVQGDPLSETLGKVGRITAPRTMSLMAQAADALFAAHQKGIVHRDVKPGNLLVRPNGTLVLTDFGIARSAAAAQLTVAGAVLGTASYLAPEQASGEAASAASDVYSLGVVAYQCLSGQRPFRGDTPVEIAMQHVTAAAPPLPDDVPDLARRVVERAMAKDPAQRWESAAGLAGAARHAAAELRKVPAPRTVALPAAVPGAAATLRGSAPVVARPAQPAAEPMPLPEDGRRGGRILGVAGIVLALLLSLLCSAYLGYQARLRSQQSTPGQSTPGQGNRALSGFVTGLSDDLAGRPMSEGRRTQ